ncbi:zinc-binding alcohol dehydrogenase family protein [Amycolatopsis carbonis]|uniref:Zinc-binding alcohol dehydrogenase family protein n=1 Tax=Amycolatopsis carbonis TaxID=715471 RepID=A0A9Y2ICB0_9PSEU|nr:zinc-binding alcohol dehydrogenase family protein [Amycolatopsis sp. 2-15]WIX77452.1 zinc-binding alcohol dehydrogenase family protein [Amycolatopsis sp. 2-15]
MLHAPRYEELETPEAGGGQLLAEVLAAGLHPRVRSGAGGTHYTGDGRLPMVPGVDGVGRLPDGRRVYFVAGDDGPGTMAERAVLDPRRAVELPEAADAVAVAAAMNPATSSWVALRRRVDFEPGQSVLVLGATGDAGRLAVEVARHLGASEIVAVGRDPRRLELITGLGATRVVSTADADKLTADVDVVLDYTWGAPAELAMRALVTHRTERSKPLAWVQMGSPAGADVTLPSALLRAANLRIMGSGQGSLTTAGIVAELPALLDELAAGTFGTAAKAIPLAEVEDTWTAPSDPGERIVFTP